MQYLIGLSKYVDDVRCAYSTPRTLVIKDRRIGIALFLARAAIFIYIVTQVFTDELYMAPSDLTSTVRLTLREPDAAFRWGGGAAPFCSGVTEARAPSAALGAEYAILSADAYAWRGGPPQPRRPCAYLDAEDAVPILETDRALISSEVRSTRQRLVSAATGDACASREQAGCVWAPPYNGSDAAVTRRVYVPDIEFFTILFDHSMVAPLANVARTVRQMSGSLRDARGRVLDPCEAYASAGLACPRARTAPDGGVQPGVNVGAPGVPDVVPVRALMLAAGIASLDQVAGSDNAAVQSSAYRQQGLVLIVDIGYSNYKFGRVVFAKDAPPTGGTGTFDNSVVQYMYRVFVVPETQFQVSTARAPWDNETARIFERIYGVRLVVTTSGTIGYTNLQTLLINLVVSLGLLSVAVTIIDLCVFSACPLRGLYSRLREERTVRISDLLAAKRSHPEDFAQLLRADADADEGEDEEEGGAAAGRVAAAERARQLVRRHQTSPPVVASSNPLSALAAPAPAGDAAAARAGAAKAWAAENAESAAPSWRGTI
jgi:hypothetical protein